MLATTTGCCSLSRVSVTSGGHAAEQYLPENLRSLRERKGMSQAALAKAMADREWRWHQQTVYKVETGERGIAFGEATDLADILGVSTDRLTWSGPEANETAMVDRSIALVRQSWRETAEAVTRLLADRAGGRRVLAGSSGSRYARVRQACAELEAELEASGVETAVAEGTARHRKPEAP